ncbi:monooxygenase 2-like [Mercurialis annua]|uniref:monooxygenase 2-like n=1 Tax=Mercurialis annua TaxID=3986 RepID=UPI0021605AD7|nr:monooxygenase 2-like [Mercurialis annua]
MVLLCFDAEEIALDSSTKMKQIVLRKLEDGIGNSYIKNVVETTEVENIDAAPLGFRFPMEFIWANISKDNVCVAGDALHPMTPDVGQGGCSSLEDGFVMARCLAKALKSSKKTINGEYDGDEERAGYERIVSGLQKYANERRWRSFDLVTTSYLVGVLLESDNLVLKFLREKVLGQFLGGLLLKRADYDFGKLCVT